uniref:Uncharacterized protein n=1 Tax=Tetraselmis sp. GSL018 TaxID=582737 RepID=A0A061RX88_9CHLO|mmetsp:Transcript_15755/g.37411  ORF Transcript_15755/g.37411 Transcript_15755/m.37411 type:complete len:399 (+) Transcript_15755:248-1444(+)
MQREVVQRLVNQLRCQDPSSITRLSLPGGLVYGHIHKAGYFLPFQQGFASLQSYSDSPSCPIASRSSDVFNTVVRRHFGSETTFRRGETESANGPGKWSLTTLRSTMAERFAKPSLAGRAIYRWIPKPVQCLMSCNSGEHSQVLKLHLEAFWQNNGNVVTATVGAATTYGLWKTVLLTGGLIGWEPTLALKLELMGLSAAAAYGGLHLAKHRRTIDPDAVYRSAMRQLNSHAGVLEAMGAPLAGAEMRACVLSGGGLTLRGLRPAFRPHRLHMLFVLRGADARGVVAIDAKRRRGQTTFRLLAVDIPSSAGNNVRIFLHGQPSQLLESSVFDELQKPLCTVLAMKGRHDADDAAELAQEAIARDVLLPKPLSQGGGMYLWERPVEWYHDMRQRFLKKR